ncbi:SMP-30/gluconolactonase/LRE family protein [Acetobacteraceae bacterium KSS8]|uniref:SMP-30/gluconolactonase/LRE family protein n=1 Tax=Endosaccharibacter trunci TaxID=2812733 RepID=A0ABT1WB02_9PROT|nr:SMP-30/gluconolactonase/LRE family protein [Acetobacteraceae bacterium KSS8]
MTLFPEPTCIWDLKAELGEGLVWMEREAALYGVDILGRTVFRFHPESGARTVWDAPARPTFLVPDADGHLLCGCADGLRTFNGATGVFGTLTPVESFLPENRLNDACADRQGRLWFGSMHDPETEASGSLYRLDSRQGAEPVQMDTGYVVSNGPAIDPLRNRLYHNDSVRQTVFLFDLAEGGTLSNKRPFARIETGYPDGMTVDRDGFLWVALYAGGGVQRFAPDGTPDRFVRLPASNITKIVFGGPDYRTAFVSSARKSLSAEALAAQPLAGGLFRFEVEVPGLPPCVFRA